MSGRYPDFLVIGARKAGTTSLYYALAQHPQIFMSPVKEPRFFTFEGSPPAFRKPAAAKWDFVAITDRAEYQALFAGAAPHQLCGEASPIYSSGYRCEETADNIQRTIPAAKLIMILRHPAERAWSEFHYQRQLGNEPCPSLEEALACEDAPHRAAISPDLLYFRTGLYSAHLKHYYDRFPPEQIRVFLYEDWQQEPETVLEGAVCFLELESGHGFNVERHNPTIHVRSRRLARWLETESAPRKVARAVLPGRLRHALSRRLRRWTYTRPRPMPSALRRELTTLYRDDIESLQALIGRDLSHWLD
ncbi:MAG: sulfotransferase domain-containing protein [Planctomycetota bacterium]